MPWKGRVITGAKRAGVGAGAGAAVQSQAGVQVWEATSVAAQDMYLEVLRGLAVVLLGDLSLEALPSLPLVLGHQKQWM